MINNFETKIKKEIPINAIVKYCFVCKEFLIFVKRVWNYLFCRPPVDLWQMTQEEEEECVLSNLK